jgi:hypothetical protein
MSNEVAGSDWVYRFRLVDIRDVDGENLLASDNRGDNVIAILTRFGNEPGAVRRVLRRISDGPPGQGEEALVELSFFAGLRKLDDDVKRETKRMPIQKDIMENTIIGPMIRQGQMELLLCQIEGRFGDITPQIRKRLEGLNPDQIKEVALRLLKAQQIEDLFAH